MKKLLTIAVLFGMSLSAQAVTLASGSIYGGTTATFGLCYLFNAGNATVGITSKQIFAQSSAIPVALASNNCGTTLAPGATCVFVANTTGFQTYACRAVTSAAGIRGSFELRQGGNTILQRGDLK